MEYLTDGELDTIIKKHWPGTTPTKGMYKMMRDAADLRLKKHLALEETQEPVASYRLSAPITEPNTDTQAAKPMTDEQIMRIAGDLRLRNAGAWPGDVAFARAIESHLKGEGK